MSPRTRRLAGPLLVGGAVLLGTAYVGLVDPNQPGHYPLCPTKALTGLDCPFCGGLRSVHALAHGDVAGALSHNALVVLLAVPALVLWVRWLRRAWTGEPPRPVSERLSPGASRALLWTATAVVLAFTVARNIDTVPALAWLGSATV